MVSYMGIEMPASSFADAFFVRQLDAPAYSALALSLYWIMMVPSRLMMGLVKRRHLKLISFFCVAMVAVAAAIARTENPHLSLVLFAAAGFLCGPVWPTIFATSQRSFSHATGTVGSVCTALGGLGGFLFPALFGFISEGSSLAAVYVSVAGAAALCFVLSMLTRRLMRQKGIEPA